MADRAMAQQPLVPLEQLIGSARDAAAGRDWPAALEFWRQVISRSPEGAVGWVGASIALRELDRLAEARDLTQAAARRFPNHIGVLIEVVATLQKQQDWEPALAQWAIIRERHPDNPVGYLGAVWPLRVLARFAETEALLADAVARFPGDAQIAVQFAVLAADSNRPTEALTRWQTVREHFPNDPRGFTGGAGMLRQLQRFDEAGQLVDEAGRLFPDHLDVAKELAVLAEQLRDWPTATARWEAIRDGFPDQPFGYVGLSSIFISQSKPREAEVILDEAIPRFPRNLELRLLHAQTAMQLRHLPDALPRWQAAFDIAPQNLHAITGLCECLLEMGDVEAAGARLEAIANQRLTSPQVAIAFGNLATRRQDWVTAKQYWEDARRAFPENRELGYRVAAARMRMLDHLVLDDGTIEDRPPPAVAAHLPAAKPDAAILDDPEIQRAGAIFRNFESLGDNCEFGIVQRAFGLEPLGLLRWSATPADRLIEALKERFPGVGDLSQTVLRDIDGEFLTEDRRFYMMMHTFIQISGEKPEPLLQMLCRRLKFLRRKMLEDLAGGDKIFVYKSTSGVGDDVMREMSEALSLYGPNRLLAVRLADAEHPSGSLQVITPRLAFGYIGSFSIDHPIIAAWQSVCEQAYEMLPAPELVDVIE